MMNGLSDWSGDPRRAGVLRKRSDSDHAVEEQRLKMEAKGQGPEIAANGQ